MSTCTAPDHPDCTIDCDDGCYAVYWEPDGPCDTGCSDQLGKLKFKTDSRISICLRDISSSSLGSLFEELSNVSSSDKKISLTMKNASRSELLDRVRKAIS
jgi:hypothetical protein